MNTEFTNEFMRGNCGCYKQNELMATSFMQGNPPTVKLETILNSEIPLKDKYWFFGRKTNLTIRQKQELAIGVAEIVLEIYEKRYPDNKAPRECVQASKDYLNGIITLDTLRSKRAAAAAADAAYAAARTREQTFTELLTQYLFTLYHAWK